MKKGRRERERLAFVPSAVLVGILLSLVFTALISIPLGTAIYYAYALEEQKLFFAMITGLAGIWLGGAVAASRAKTAGWLHGSLTGLGFVFCSWLVGGGLVAAGSFFSLVFMYRLFWGAVLGALGGMMGITLSSNR